MVVPSPVIVVEAETEKQARAFYERIKKVAGAVFKRKRFRMVRVDVDARNASGSRASRRGSARGTRRPR